MLLGMLLVVLSSARAQALPLILLGAGLLIGSPLYANVTQPFVPATGIAVDVAVQVSIDSSAMFTYQYSVRSATTSIQKVYNFFVDEGGVPATSGNPIGWSFVGFSKNLTANWGADVGGDIVPGNTLTGFYLKTRGLPVIVNAYVRGLAPLPAVDDEEDSDSIGRIPDAYHDAVIVQTIGPSSTTASDVGTFALQLISLKHQAFSLGWIYGPGADGVVQSLDAKLAAANASISKGDNKTAANQLNAFINELEAQRGKHVNDNAYFLLTANAQFIMAKL